jgi:Flp pilus assembly protein TadG
MRTVRGKRQSSAGQSLVEFAILSIALFMLLLGAAQVGSIVYAHIGVQTAAREAARAATQQPFKSLGASYSGATVTCSGGATPTCVPVSGCTPACAAAYSSTSFAGGGLQSSNFTVTYSACPNGAACGSALPVCGVPAGSQSYSDGWVTATVSYKSSVFIPLLGNLLSDPGDPSHRTVQSSVTMRIEPCTFTRGK